MQWGRNPESWEATSVREMQVLGPRQRLALGLLVNQGAQVLSAACRGPAPLFQATGLGLPLRGVCVHVHMRGFSRYHDC